MNLSSLLSLTENISTIGRVLSLAETTGDQRVVVFPAAKPYLLASLRKALGRPMLVVTSRPEKARRLQDELLAWCGEDAPVYLLPEPDALPYERLPSEVNARSQRLRCLAALTDVGVSDRMPLVVASLPALVQKTSAPADFISLSHTIEVGDRLKVSELMARWLRMGYETNTVVELPGTMNRRGGIIDIYPPQSPLPARIELFGDNVESLRLFDPPSQRSVRLIDSVSVHPARELLLPESGFDIDTMLERLASGSMNGEARDRMERELAFLAAGQAFDGLEFYLPLFHQSTILDYLPDNALVILDEPSEIQGAYRDLEAQVEELRQSQLERGELPESFPQAHVPWSELEARLSKARRLALESWDAGGAAAEDSVLPFVPASAYGGRLRVLLREVKAMGQGGQRVLIVSQQANRLSELFREQDIVAQPVSDAPPLNAPGSFGLVLGSLPEGWVIKINDNVLLTLLTDSEIFGISKQRRPVRRPLARRSASVGQLSLTIGDYVVHIDHGIARYGGLVRMKVDEVEREYLVLEYAAGDKLYVPTDQVDRVARYVGPSEYVPALSRLGTQEWARLKQRVRASAGDIAQELLDLYSAREVAEGFAFSPDTAWQREMETSFPYVETPDQLQAVEEVKRDMETPKPMDRLVCGDVGYGKTEVALRAAFKAVMDGSQVAVLVPTTVLAQQHYNTLSDRLSAFPVKVEMLSRFRSEKEQEAILEGLKEGTIDICVGTHRLLSRDVAFKNLRLIVIDEEQRFGVVHKEALKKLRQEVDVLSLTATPIPRTLHMSLVGVRDMSTIETPPEERLPIKTYVAEYNERLIRDAILREMDRGGQVFFVHNRVQSIYQVTDRLRELVPEAEFLVGHGQMPEEMLARVMVDFAAGKADVLVCTTIIESGLDMPNVNTLIVNQADKFGLAQLYQLRGRVGRAANRAYAYFLYNKGKVLTETATKRLQTIFEATELGAGFQIAMKDLEIRGAGNLLGVEQSGHVGAVGFDLYCRLLAEAVEERKARQAGKMLQPPVPEPSIDLPLAAHIPYDYVTEENLRLALYRRLAEVKTPEQAEEMAQELYDRFGRMPQPVNNLVYVVQVKVLATRALVESIATEGRQLVVQLQKGVGLERGELQRAFGDKVRAGQTQVRLDMARLGNNWRAMLLDVLQKMAGMPVEA